MSGKQDQQTRELTLQRRHDIEVKLDANKHHVLFEKCYWTVGSAVKLREDSDLIVLMDKDTHQDLHRAVPPVPPLGNMTTKHLLEKYQSLKQGCDLPSNVNDFHATPIAGIALLNLALDQLTGWEHITPLEVTQIQLIKDNLQWQPQFIRESDRTLEQRCFDLDVNIEDYYHKT